jgi:hypothetical protein
MGKRMHTLLPASAASGEGRESDETACGPCSCSLRNAALSTRKAPACMRSGIRRAAGMKNTQTMKAALLVSGLILFGAFNATAQTDQKLETSSRTWVAMNVAKLNVQLGLNDVQQAKVKDIDDRYMQKHQAYGATMPKPSDKQMEDKVAKLMTERDNDMRAVLNAEQYEKWMNMRQKGTGELREEQQEKKEQQEMKK